MNVSAPFIRRPIGTILLALGIFMVGVVAYFLLPVAALPSVDFPAVFINTQYPGAAPEVMAATVAAPIERHVGEIPGLSELTSVSSLGNTVIIALFDINRNVDGSARDVQAALNAAAVDLPAGLPSVPIFRKANPNNAPVLILALTSDELSPSAVYDAADSVLVQRISQIDGVAEVSVAGADQPAIRISADPTKLSDMGLSMDDLRTTIVNANAISPTGIIDGDRFGRAISTNDQLKTLADYRNLVVKNAGGTSVILGDVATVAQATRNSRSEATFNGAPAVLIYVRKQASANVIKTVDAVKALIPQTQRFLPAGLKVSVLNDRTATIRSSVDHMVGTLLATIVLVMMVVFIFLRRVAATAAAGVTVPLALAGTCACMYAAGFSIDNISLMALATSVGFVVDDAIVMIEVIDKNRELGMKPMQAALAGSTQIGFTVISISISLLAAFIPLLLLGGLAGRLFREFSITLAFAIVISTVASLTITPMVSANFGGRHKVRAPNLFDRIVEGVLDSNARFYAATLRVVLRHRILTLLTFFATIGLTVYMFAVTPKAAFPADDTDLIIATSEAPPETSYQAMVPLQNALAAQALKDPAVQNVGSSLGNPGGGPNSTSSNEGKIFISLKPLAERGNITAEGVIARLRKRFKKVVGIDTFMVAQQDLRFGGRDSKSTEQFTLSDNDYPELTKYYPLVEEKLKTLPMLVDVTTDHEASGLQANVDVDRIGHVAPRRDHGQYRQFHERQLCAASDLDHLLAAQPVPRGAREQGAANAPGQRPPQNLRPRRCQPAELDRTWRRRRADGAQPRRQHAGDHRQRSVLDERDDDRNHALAAQTTSASTTVSGLTAGAVISSSANAQSSTQSAAATGQVRLDSMAKVGIGFAPLTVNHQGQFPEVTISYNLKPGTIKEEANAAVLKTVADMHLPDTLHAEFSGDTKLFRQSAGSQGLLLYAALISVYIVLGVLYESLAHPLTIISTLPSAGLGALLALNITGTELSLIAFIGIVLLIGIVKKNGIMLVDFALHAERDRGLPAAEAIYEACIERFRPILMTTLAALLGAVPLIVSSGPGSAFRRPLGITIAGGLIVSQVLTLYTTPVIYLYLDKLHQRLRRMRLPRRRASGVVAPAE